jgi:iron complex outermembrane receptor protein
MAYGWQRAHDPSQAGPLTNAPRHLLKLQWSDTLHQATGPVVGVGRYAIEAIGIGPRSTVRGTRLPGHVLTNMTYTTRIAGTDVSVGVYNLFDRRHSDPASFEIREDAVRQDGRTYRIKLTYAF